jgi:hypothetical protein
MTHEHSRLRNFQHWWYEEDAERDERERRAKQMLLEQEANQIFAPIENYLTYLDKVLRAAGASVEVDGKWEHIGDQKLRRVANVRFNKSAQQLPLDLTVQGVTILYREKPYRFVRGIEALIAAITSELEQFLNLKSRSENLHEAAR